MSELFEACTEFLGIYRERNFHPNFWAEPLNAVTNASFVIAGGFAWRLASQRRATTLLTNALLSIALAIAFGSFFFHTIPNRFTKALDIAPIALFQALFLWLVCRWMLSLSRAAAAAVVIGVVGASFALLPVQQPLNGSLFYLPALAAMATLGTLYARRSNDERYLLLGAASCFAVAIAVRSVDWVVPWRFGTHFLWHLLNGVVVYLTLRAWVVYVAAGVRTAGLLDGRLSKAAE